MVIQSSPELEKIRPKLIPSLLSGFETVANHIWLILLPVCLDLGIWLGPHIRIQTVMQPFVDSMKNFADMNGQQMADSLKAAQSVWQMLLEKFNVIFALRTFPVGIPSLMSNWLPLQTPYGKPMSLELKSYFDMAAWWIVLTLLGLLVSSYFYGKIAQVTGKKTDENLTPGIVGWMTLQLLTLTVLVILLVLLLGFPAMLVLSVLTVLSPTIGQLALFFIGLVVIWLLVPLVFSAHGIFTNHFPLIKSIATSIQVVRLTFTSTSLFVLVLVIISQGLNMLWQVPQENSWLLLVGIFGHAFVNTSLIAASFVYYRDGLKFLQTLIAKSQMVQPSSPVIN
jgi:hypothetical protein